MSDEWSRYRREQAERWLGHVAARVRRVDALRAEVDAKRTELDGLHAIDYSRPAVSVGMATGDDAMVDALYGLNRAISGYCRELADLTAEQADAHARLASLADATGAAALSMHYLAGLEWTEVADRLGYSKRHVFRIRDAALVEAYGVMPPEWRDPLPPAT